MTHLFGHTPLRASESVQMQQSYRPNEKFAPLPAPTGPAPYRLSLSEIIPDPTDTLVFHVIGDSGGIVDPTAQKAVAAAMVADLPSGVKFCYHVGDLAYFNGDASAWFPQVYEPYEYYTVPIMGVPGNHDGDNSDDLTVPSLTAFVENMCATTPHLTQQAGDVDRTAMVQPNVYWTLNANLVTIIGLYSNVPSGGVIKDDQAQWLEGELAAAPTDRPVIIVLHHPPYSADAHHGGCAKMGAIIDTAAEQSGRWPDMVLAGHVHDYQRFTRTDKNIPYIVCGGGGYHNLHAIAPDVTSLPWDSGIGVTLEAYQDKVWGFLRLTVTGGKISGNYVTVTRDGEVTVGADIF